MSIRRPTRRKFYINVVVGLMLLVLLITPSTTFASEVKVDRLSGLNRYDTAVKVAQAGWSSAETVVLTIGTNFPDALAGTPLAYSLDAPILLTAKDVLPAETKQEIARLKPKSVIILGGPQIISEKVESELTSLGVTSKRIFGQNRYETAVKISQELNSPSDTAVVAFGGNFPDSLSIASFAAQNKYPIFLIDKTSIPAIVKEELKKYSRTIIVGGVGVVSSEVEAQVPNPVRIAGQDRYSTSANIVKQLSTSPLEPAYIATGQNFADALSGSVLAAKRNSAILLVQTNQAPAPIKSFVTDQNIANLSIIGGTGAVSNNVVAQFTTSLEEYVVQTAKSLRGVPYAWGGTTPRGFDCSGYLNYVFAQHNISLPRTTADIWAYGTSVSSPSIGDIVFFETYKPGPSHAGIYIGNNQFIHASSSSGVTISSLGESYWKARYLGVKKVIK